MTYAEEDIVSGFYVFEYTSEKIKGKKKGGRVSHSRQSKKRKKRNEVEKEKKAPMHL